MTSADLCAYLDRVGHPFEQSGNIDYSARAAALVEAERRGFDVCGEGWTPFDKNGFDRQGYNRHGYNRQGKKAMADADPS